MVQRRARRDAPGPGGRALHRRQDDAVDDVDDAVRRLDIGGVTVASLIFTVPMSIDTVMSAPLTVVAIMPSDRSPDMTAPGTTW
jgi:hypothetical protein